MTCILMILHENEPNVGIPKNRSNLQFLTYDGGPGVFCIHWFVKQFSGNNGTVTHVNVHWLYNQLFATSRQQFRSCGWVGWL